MKAEEMVPKRVCIVIDTTIYSLEALKKTAYKFASNASVLITPQEGTKVEVVFRFPNHLANESCEQVISDFQIELADQDLREIIKNETIHVRNLILAHAFSRSSLIKQE